MMMMERIIDGGITIRLSGASILRKITEESDSNFVTVKTFGTVAEAQETFERLPWERGYYGISAGYVIQGHSHFCEECARNHYLFENWDDVEIHDVTHFSQMECESNDPCMNWVGDQCSNEEIGCTNSAEGYGLCEECGGAQ